ncbi:hypothetical protein [Parafilimonas sp.]|uniref:hypothetical protein n=1 Tax=Parafilimonas sp. TaxID=1969739 RepID=UPI0039E705A0
MKKLYLFFISFFLCIAVFAQNDTIAVFDYNQLNKKPSILTKQTLSDSLVKLLSLKKDDIKFLIVIKNIPTDINLDLNATDFTADASIKGGYFNLYQDLKTSYNNKDTNLLFKFRVSSHGSPKKLIDSFNIAWAIITANESISKLSPSLPFVDSNMINSVSKSSNCDLCSQQSLIHSKKDRKYSTDYLITFDASRKLDDYTICKHIYNKKSSNDTDENGKRIKLIERYRKVSPAWFAPSVGSQLKFQVINQPLADKSKIIVNDSDLFIDNSSFQSVVSNQLALTLLSASRNATAKSDSSKTKGTSTDEDITNKPESDSIKVQRLLAELSNYLNAFNISPCSISENRSNLIIIKSRIQSQFNLSTDVLDDLVKKFDTTNQKDIAIAVKNIVSGLDSLKPLVYSTPRLVNRDYINIKVVNSNNETIADENIRTSFGLKIDYSAGVFLTGLRDDNFAFFDTTVSYKPDSAAAARDTSGSYIKKQTVNNMSVGFGVLVHVYPRISSNYNFGITTGFMATTNVDLNILLGGSFILQSLFGSNNRVVFNGGIAWGKVKRLSTSYQKGYHTETVTDLNHPSYTYNRPVFYSTTGDPTVQVWRTSWFFGITFNFR